MQKLFILGSLTLGLCLMVLSGCNASSSRVAAPADAEVEAEQGTVFQVKGVVRKVPETGTTIVIHHEEIPDYMMEMTMPFVVKDAAQLQGLKAGDAVKFEYHVTPEGSWIEEIQPDKETDTGAEP